jgi:hypothetical protein
MANVKEIKQHLAPFERRMTLNEPASIIRPAKCLGYRRHHDRKIAYAVAGFGRSLGIGNWQFRYAVRLMYG